MIFKKFIQKVLKMIKLHYLNKKLLDLNIEELKIKLKIMKEEIKE